MGAVDVRDGKIIDAGPGYVTIRVDGFDGWERYARRLYEDVLVGFRDGRTITGEQRRKAYALIGEIAAWSGMEPADVKDTTKHDYLQAHVDGLEKELFSLSDTDVTTAREYISYLVDFVIRFGVPCSRPLYELCDDIRRYVYACTTHKVCAVCGKPADLHHVDRVGMGRSRDDMIHIGMACLPLCRAHHMEAHQHGDAQLLDKYHLEPVEIDDNISKIYHLKRRKAP